MSSILFGTKYFALTCFKYMNGVHTDVDWIFRLKLCNTQDNSIILPYIIHYQNFLLNALQLEAKSEFFTATSLLCSFLGSKASVQERTKQNS